MAEFITMFGGDSQVGTTLLSAALAEKMTQKGRKVLLLLASQETDEGWFPQTGGGFESLLRTQEPGRDELKNAVSNPFGKFHFDYIAGAKDCLSRQFYRPQLIKDIRSLLDRDYDLILADAGSDATLPLPAACLAWADRRCYVLTGSPKCLVRFESIFRSVILGLAPELSKDLLILNKAGQGQRHAALSSLTEAFGLRGLSIACSPDGLSWELNPQEAFQKEPQSAVLEELTSMLAPKAGV